MTTARVPYLYKIAHAAARRVNTDSSTDGLISSRQLRVVKRTTLRVQILSLVSIFFVLQTNPTYALSLSRSYQSSLKRIFENNPPPAKQRVYKFLFGVTCPTQVKLGDWEYTGIDVHGSINSTAARACLGLRLQKYERETNLSAIPSECRSNVKVQTEQQYRCEY